MNNEKELELYIGRLDGESWKSLARAQYEIASNNKLTHKEAMISVYEKIIEVGTGTLISVPQGRG